MSPLKIVVPGTGGALAGTSAAAHDTIGYAAAQLGIDELLGAIAHSSGRQLDAFVALVELGVCGLAAAGTVNGTIHHAREAALQEAQAPAGWLVPAKRCAPSPIARPAPAG